MLKADYLVIGAGAVALAFVDEILSGSDATVVMIDRREGVGGHWRDAYPFVRLHQPSAYYGVGSRVLGSNRIDPPDRNGGLNAGLYELATGSEVLAYFEALVAERFLPSGRVTFLPRCEHLGGGALRPLDGGTAVEVQHRTLVDATWYNTTIPKTHTRSFEVEPGVRVVTANDIAEAPAPQGQYVILGGGKTAMDVGTFLLQQGVEADRIRWVVPRAASVINRAFAQPHRNLEYQTLLLEASAQATSAEDLIDRLEACGSHMRLHPDERPQVFRGATLGPVEAARLSQITNVVRVGHVRRIERTRLLLDQGEAPARPDDLYIDCTATAINPGPTRPVFEDRRITLQMVRSPLICFSAAIVGRIEATQTDMNEKNDLCRPVEPNRGIAGLPEGLLHGLAAAERWARNSELRAWMSTHRLTGAGLPGPEPDVAAALRVRFREARGPAIENLQRLVAGG